MDFEKLFIKALGALIDMNGGSLESALDDMRIEDKKLRKEIKEFLAWDDDEAEDFTEDDLDADDLDDIEFEHYEED